MEDKLVSNGNLGHPARTEQFLRLLMAGQSQIYSYILALVQSWVDADDVMQETTSRMWSKFGQFEPGTNFIAWGIQIAHYEVMNFRRKHKPGRMQFNDGLLGAIAQRVEKDENQLLYLDILQTCVQKLSERDRKLITMKYEANITTKEVARRINRNVHNLYKTMARIHDALLKCVHRTLAQETV